MTATHPRPAVLAADGEPRHRDGAPLRIALTADPELPVPPVHYGGIERIVDLLATALAARGHAVTLFAHPDSTAPVALRPWPGRHSGARADCVRNAAFLARHVAAGRFDVVHSFSRLAYLAPLLAWPIPKLMSYQREISPRTTRLAHRLARGSLAFSAISRQMIGPDLAGPWHLVPNAVQLDTYPFRAEVAADAPLMFLGRIEAIKGPDLAIEAARRSGRRLVLAGNVPDAHRGWFAERIEPHLDGAAIRYVGPVDDARKAALLGESCALLMPIRWEEPFGIVMIEAMACGTPVVGLRRGAVPEVVADGETGYVVDGLDALVDAVGRIDRIDRRACRARVERLYGADPVAEAYLAVYRDLLAGRAGAA